MPDVSHNVIKFKVNMVKVSPKLRHIKILYLCCIYKADGDNTCTHEPVLLKGDNLSVLNVIIIITLMSRTNLYSNRI